MLDGQRNINGLPVFVSTLPGGGALLERVALLPAEQRGRSVAVVTLLTDRLDRSQLSALRTLLPQLKLIANYAVGFNNIDVQAARELNLAVTNTPGVLGDATADLTMTLILMVTRRVWNGALELHQQGRFAGWSPDYGLGMDLKGKMLGIVGWGDIGQRVAARARAFGMSVVALQSVRSASVASSLPSKGDPQKGAVGDEDEVARGEVQRLPEESFLKAVDILSFHCPLTPQTQGWLHAGRLAQMRRGSIVINTSRGEVVDESALAHALRLGHLLGAGLDVFCGEPVVSEALRGVPNLVILPHLGSATIETRTAMSRCVMENVGALLAGEWPLPTQVNAKELQ
jgi:glyoxylate reductase